MLTTSSRAGEELTCREKKKVMCIRWQYESLRRTCSVVLLSRLVRVNEKQDFSCFDTVTLKKKKKSLGRLC